MEEGTAITGVRRDPAHRPAPRRQLIMGHSTVGGALVTRPFSFNGKRRLAGETLTAKEVLSIPVMNRRALANRGFMEVFPDPSDRGSFYVTDIGLGKFAVIQGVVVSSDTMPRKEAEKLCDKYNAAMIAATKNAAKDAPSEEEKPKD